MNDRSLLISYLRFLLFAIHEGEYYLVKSMKAIMSLNEVSLSQVILNMKPIIIVSNTDCFESHVSWREPPPMSLAFLDANGISLRTCF